MTFEADNLSVTSKSTLPRVPFLDIKEKILGKKYELSITFVGSARAKALNIAHRGKEYVPNTLSFPLSKKSGEIVLCMPAIRKEFKTFGFVTVQKYLIFIVIHSCLHLKGYDHGRIMERKEKQLLTVFA